MSNEPPVSDEDRQAAVAALREAYDRMPSVFSHDELANTMTDALVSHGWGPRPAVSPTKLGEFIDQANAGGMAVPWRGLQDYLRECGIEVTD